MAEVVLFHHMLGLTEGVRDFAATLDQAGHTVHLPDLYDGVVLETLEAGEAHLQEIGFGTAIERGVAAVEGLSDDLVYAGFSLGVLPAQKLAQTRAGARGALLFHSCLPLGEFGDEWPAGVPVQVHGMDNDPYFVGEGDLEYARELVEASDDAELFLYPGNHHLFVDDSLAFYDEPAATLLTERVLAFLEEIG